MEPPTGLLLQNYGPCTVARDRLRFLYNVYRIKKGLTHAQVSILLLAFFSMICFAQKTQSLGVNHPFYALEKEINQKACVAANASMPNGKAQQKNHCIYCNNPTFR